MISWRRLLTAVGLAGSLAQSMGCGDVAKTAPAKECAKAYEQCVMPSGVLGVCNVVDCAAGQSEPCLLCRSQH